MDSALIMGWTQIIFVGEEGLGHESFKVLGGGDRMPSCVRTYAVGLKP